MDKVHGYWRAKIGLIGNLLIVWGIVSWRLSIFWYF